MKQIRSEAESAEPWWFMALRVLAASLVQAITLGGVLSYGMFVDNLFDTMLPDGRDVYLVGLLLFVVFLFTGSAMSFFHESLRWCGFEVQSRDRIINLTGSVLWIAGFGGSIALTEDYVGFACVVTVLGGVGSGLLFWNMWSMLPSWIPIHSWTFPLAAFCMAVGSHAYVFSFSYILYGLDYMRRHQPAPVPDSLWAFAYKGMVPSLGFVLVACSLGVVSSSASMYSIINHNLPAKYKRVYVGFLVGVALFQAAFNLPFMYLPSFVDITMNGTVLEQTAVVSSLSGGTVVGKLLGAIFLGCLNPAKDRAEVTTRFVFQSVAMLWGAGYVITVCAWLSCSAVPNTIAMAFFLGLFGGGISICIHVAAYVSSIDLIDNTKPAGLMSFLAFSQSIGQALSTLISHYAMADAHWGFVYIAIAFGGATWLVFLILPQFAPRPRT